jgi:hypothetical protein
VLAELEQLELTATVNSPKGGGEPNMALAIPTGPVKRVERRLPDGRWVGQTDYERELAGSQTTGRCRPPKPTQNPSNRSEPNRRSESTSPNGSGT